MSSDLAHYILRHGYLAIFLLVLLQELGVPNPVTNEFVLLFSGYLAFSGALNLWLVILTAVSADCVGTTILYVVFYVFGNFILEHRPRWFPVSQARVAQVTDTISHRQQWGIYVGRHIPFLRGYVSIAAGLLSLPPRIFLPAVVLSAITGSGSYVVAGRLLGPYWELVASKIGAVATVVLLAVLIVIAVVVCRRVLSKKADDFGHE